MIFFISKSLRNCVELRFVDSILGLDLDKIKPSSVPQEVNELVRLREKFRKKKNWHEADLIRVQLKEMGFVIDDTDKGPKVNKTK